MVRFAIVGVLVSALLGSLLFVPVVAVKDTRFVKRFTISERNQPLTAPLAAGAAQFGWQDVQVESGQLRAERLVDGRPVYLELDLQLQGPVAYEAQGQVWLVSCHFRYRRALIEGGPEDVDLWQRQLADYLSGLSFQ